MKYILMPILCFLSLDFFSDCSQAKDAPSEIQYTHWQVQVPPLFQAGKKNSFDDIATKDPSIVFYQNRYHLFYTSKSSLPSGKVRTGLGYASAEKLEDLSKAKRVDLNKQLESVIIAPQVFYYRPHKTWYLVGHTGGSRLHTLKPVYMTNPNIANVDGWSKPVQIQTTSKANDDFWIDFWVICDNKYAYLFYTDHTGTVYQQKTEKKKFPQGFNPKSEAVAVKAKGHDKHGDWRIHEASHIYHVKSDNRYLMIVEATRPHPKKSQYWDSRNRFLLGFTANSLDGPWKRIDKNEAEYFGDPQNLFNVDGSRSHYSQVSHPELIRSGYDERLQIANYQLEMIFQAFDASKTSPEYDYHHLPWEISIMRNE